MSNSIHYWKTKAECYGNVVHGCQPALEAAGYPVNDEQRGGAVKGIRDAVEAIAADKAALEAENQRLRELLKGSYDYNEWCSYCGTTIEDESSHTTDCELAAALKEPTDAQDNKA